MHEVVPDTLPKYASHTAPRLRAGSTLARGRFSVLETLGQGGMGTVYRAFDSERQCQVALKTMNRLDAVNIYALKNEFRALGDVHHPNLVRLFELFCEETLYFFTLELIAGERFDLWVRPQARLDERRLRACFAQLLSGLAALHGCGKLHRDIKPSNVIVKPDGHVVVLDFGLVTAPHADGIGQTVTDHSLVGTPAYLAPEQVLGQPATPASDLYAVGVMLFEALTGKLPFDGNGAEVLIAKQQTIPAWPRATRRAVPEDLVELCDRLLARNPRERPDLLSVCRYFEQNATELAPRSTLPPPMPQLPAADLIGRTAELAQLRAAYASTLAGKPAVISVSGESGIGKSAVCNAFLDELAREGHAILLRGRCNERESVPFKAFDTVVDALSRYLRRLRPERAAAVLPRDAAALITLFPVLGRVDVLAEAPARATRDAHEHQRRAFAAFHELLGRMRDRTPLVIHVDDLQWTDRDSTLLLRFLLLHAEQLPLLWIFSHRNDGAGENELVDVVLEAARANREIECSELPLPPLSAAGSSALAERILPQVHADSGAIARRIDDEARGNPFLIAELARFIANSATAEESALSLSAAIDARLENLPGAGRTLLSLLALAAQPLPTELALEAAGASHSDVDALQRANLVRMSMRHGDRKLEFYHDRIRERFRERLTADEVRALYVRLARACSGRAEIEPDMRCAYLEGAGELAAAATCAARAADDAVAALAFDNAARLYGKALELGAHTPVIGLRLATQFAHALANAGRSTEAAAAYQRAALLANGEAALDLRRRGAEQLLTAGHAAEGMGLLERVCADAGLRLPQQNKLGQLSLALVLGKLRLSSVTPLRQDVHVDPRRSLRLEMLQTAVVGMQCYSQAAAPHVALDYLREAERAGDVRHVVWSLGSLAMLMQSRAFFPQLLSQMDAIATRDGRAELRGLLYGLRGFVASRSGKYRESRSWFARALEAYANCVGMQWQIDLVQVFDQISAANAGDYAELTRTTPTRIDEAFRCGRVWTGTTLSGFWGMQAWLTPDDPAGYRRQLERARSHWQQQAAYFTMDRAGYGLHRAEVMLSVYEGEPLRGLGLLDQRGHSAHKPSHRRDHELLRAFCAAAALGGGRTGRTQVVNRSALIALAESPALKRAAATQPLAHVFAAAVAIERGETTTATHELGAAIESFDAAAIPMQAGAARRRLGQLVGGEHGALLVSSADALLQSQGVCNLEAMTELLCPGCATNRTAS